MVKLRSTNPVLNVCHAVSLVVWGGVETRLIEYLHYQSNPRLKHFVVALKASEELIAAVRETRTLLYAPTRAHRYDPRVFWDVQRWLRQHDIHVLHSRNRMAAWRRGWPVCRYELPVNMAPFVTR